MAVTTSSTITGVPVQNSSELPLSVYFTEVVYAGGAALTTRQTITPPTGAQRVLISPQKTTTASNPINAGIYIIFNALNDSDATTRLGQAGRYYLPIGTSKEFPFAVTSLCTRIDIIGVNLANETVGFYVGFEIGI